MNGTAQAPFSLGFGLDSLGQDFGRLLFTGQRFPPQLQLQVPGRTLPLEPGWEGSHTAALGASAGAVPTAAHTSGAAPHHTSTVNSGAEPLLCWALLNAAGDGDKE